MQSFKSKFLKLIIRNTINKNPFEMLKKSEENRVSKVAEKPEWESEDFVLTKEQTPDGVKFQRLYRKDLKDAEKVIYYLHGGAFLQGLFSYYIKHGENFINKANNCQVIFLDYKLAPEYKFPTQFNEAVTLWNDLVTRQGFKAENIIVGGDSAGGNLTLSMMLKLRDDGKQLPKAGFCISPWADMTGSGKSFEENFKKDVMFGSKKVKFSEKTKSLVLNNDIYCFIGNADRNNPYVSPVFGEYHNFPPMFFTAGGDEMLLSDTLTIIEKLKKNNIPVQWDIQPKMFHIYTLLGNKLPESEISYNKLIDFIKKQTA